MGVYHNISNETKKEMVDPGKVGGGSIKMGFVLNCGSLLAWLMANRWYGDRVQVNKDTHDHYFTAEEYTDITAEAIEEYNRVYTDKLELRKED